jgi:hypothetical protein
MKSVSVDVKAALSILDREEKENPLYGRDRLFKWLNRVGYGFIIVASLVGVAWSLWGLLGLKETFWYVVYVFIWTSILFIPLHGMTFAIMIRLNLPLVLAVRRQDRLVKKLGLAGALKAPWAGQDVVTFLVGPWLWGWGLFFMPFVLLQHLPEKAPAFFFPVPSLEGRAPVTSAVFLCFLWTLLIGYMYMWLHLLRRGEQRLRIVARLQSSLLKSAGQISPSDYNQIARIRQGLISNERAESIQNFSPKKLAFLVQKSHSVQAKQLELDPGGGLQVQAAVESLAAGAGETEATSGKAAELCWLKVPETTYEIGYSIDKIARRVRVVSLRRAAEGECSTWERTS